MSTAPVEVTASSAMRTWWLLVLTACPARPVEAPVDAGARVVEVVAVDAGWALTEEKLDAWLKYQALLAAAAPVSLDAGARDVVRQRMHIEAAARMTTGLTSADVDGIEDVVSAVVTQRNLARITGVEALRDFEKATVELSAEQKAQAEKALAEVRARAAQAGTLAEEKSKYGEDAIRVVLTRETEVTKTWDALLDARGDKR